MKQLLIALLTMVVSGAWAQIPQFYDITFAVNMSVVNVSANGVHLAGGFGAYGYPHWNPSGIVMTDPDGNGVYTAVLTLPAGQTFEYKFVNGSIFEDNLSAPCGNGSNRTITVPSATTTLPIACFSYCGNCTINNVTFRVDMSQQTVDPSGVFISGPLNGFSNAAMTDAGNGIYTYSLNLQQGTIVSYKYKNGTNGWEGFIPAPCGQGVRVLNVPGASSSVLPVDCFNSCGACPQFYDMTFAVNMANVNVSANGVHLAGGFGAYGYPHWNPSGSGIVMTDPDGNGVYTAVLTLPAGQTFEYKFINGNDFSGAEGVPAECNTSGNRVYTVPTYDAMVGGAAVCFGSCSACIASVNNDSPYSATNVLFSTNNSYPNCYAIYGSTASAGDSPQSAEYNGNDVWYRFTAQSTGVSITLTSAAQNAALALFIKTGNVFELVAGSLENASNGDFERLNFSGLTPGQVYYVSVGSASASSSGLFSLCIQHLMPSTCATVVPVGGLNICDSYKASYRGAPSQGVTYTFNFTPTGLTGGSATSLSGTNGLITLSNPTLALRYAGTYAASVDVRYNLLNGAGTAEPVDVLGSSGGNCANAVMRAQPNNEVRGTQRCNASLLRSNWLVGNSVTGDPKVCGVQSYTYEFTQVVSCADGTTVSVLPSLYNTAGTTPYLQLGVLPNLGNTGAWNVRIRPNFSYGEGTFGPVQRIQVAGTSASGELEYELVDMEKEMQTESFASIYPNPNNGDYVNVNLSGLEKGTLQVRVLDAAGRAVTTRRFAVEGSLNTTLTFDEQLSAGVYMIETLNAGRVQTQRLVVQ